MDPYVRSQALGALQHVDPQGAHARSRTVVREALQDPRDAIIRTATQLIIQYHDLEALAYLYRLQESRPEFTTLIQETLRQLGQ
jgi:hypothetical protein